MTNLPPKTRGIICHVWENTSKTHSAGTLIYYLCEEHEIKAIQDLFLKLVVFGIFYTTPVFIELLLSTVANGDLLPHFLPNGALIWYFQVVKYINLSIKIATRIVSDNNEEQAIELLFYCVKMAQN